MLLGLFSQVGFFPAECVEVIGDKIPASVQSMVPLNSNSKKPCRHASHNSCLQPSGILGACELVILCNRQPKSLPQQIHQSNGLKFYFLPTHLTFKITDNGFILHEMPYTLLKVGVKLSSFLNFINNHLSIVLILRFLKALCQKKKYLHNEYN